MVITYPSKHSHWVGHPEASLLMLRLLVADKSYLIINISMGTLAEQKTIKLYIYLDVLLV